MLVRVIHGQDIFELNPQLRAIPEFNAIDSPRQMSFVALVADYETPFKHKHGKERREAVAKELGYPLEKDGKRLDKNGREIAHGKIPKVEAAIAKYKELCFDEDKNMLEAYSRQIQTITSLMSAELSVDEKDLEKSMELAEKSGKLAKLLPEIKRSKNEVEKLIFNEPEKTEVSPSSDIEDSGVHLNALERYNLQNGNRQQN
jgi:hypothetical protein